MKKIGKIVLYFLILLGITSSAIIISGNSHLFIGVYDTYLQGRTKPGIKFNNAFAYRKIKANTPKIWEENIKKNHEYLPETKIINKALGTKAFLVIKNNKIIHEKYFDNYTDSTISNSFSMAKSILAVLTGIAVKEGKISLKDPVNKYLPELISEKDTNLRVIHLLTMTSGINFDEDYGNPFGFMAKAYYGKDIYELLKGYQVVKTPGTQYKYLGGNNLLLSLSLQKAVQKPISEYAEEKLWSKIGAEKDAFWMIDQPGGNEKSFSAFYATARDFAKIGQLYLNHGEFYGNKILDSVYIHKSIAPINVLDLNQKNTDYYGYAWWLMDFRGKKVFYMRGILGQYVLCVPKDNLIVVRLGEKQSDKTDEITPDDLYFYLEEAYRIAK